MLAHYHLDGKKVDGLEVSAAFLSLPQLSHHTGRLLIIDHFRLTTGEKSAPGSPSFQSYFPLPLIQTTQHEVSFILPRGLAEPPAALLVNVATL
jgi:hypothetical protein